jgi:hypothetical protein
MAYNRHDPQIHHGFFLSWIYNAVFVQYSRDFSNIEAISLLQLQEKYEPI